MQSNATKHLCYINPKQIICEFEKPSEQVLNAICLSFSLNGVFSPLCTVKQEDMYLLISDAAPYFAAMKMNMKRVPALVYENKTDTDVLILTHTYFYEKKDIRKLIKYTEKVTEKLSLADVSLLSGIPIKVIEDILFLGTLDQSTMRAITLTEIDVGFAKALNYLNPSCRIGGAEIIREQNLSIPKAEKMFSQLNSEKPAEKPKKTAEIKDVRFYVNSILKLADMIKSSGMGSFEKHTTDSGVDLTLHILQE